WPKENMLAKIPDHRVSETLKYRLNADPTEPPFALKSSGQGPIESRRLQPSWRRQRPQRDKAIPETRVPKPAFPYSRRKQRSRHEDTGRQSYTLSVVDGS